MHVLMSEPEQMSPDSQSPSRSHISPCLAPKVGRQVPKTGKQYTTKSLVITRTAINWNQLMERYGNEWMTYPRPRPRRHGPDNSAHWPYTSFHNKLPGSTLLSPLHSSLPPIHPFLVSTQKYTRQNTPIQRIWRTSGRGMLPHLELKYSKCNRIQK